MKSHWRSSALIRRLLQIGGRSSTHDSDGGSNRLERLLVGASSSTIDNSRVFHSTSEFLAWLDSFTETMHDGCSVTWDGAAGYAHTNPNPDAFAPRTVQLRPGLLVDTDADGFVRGVETIGHEVGVGDLLAVLRHCRLAADALEHP